MEKPVNINEYYVSLNEQEKSFFSALRNIIHQAHPNVCETLFVHQPYFYLPIYETVKFHYRPSVMMTFFRDHVNIFATGNIKYKSQLPMYKFTEKHTLQIYFNQPIQNDILVELFRKSLISTEDQQ